MTKKRFLWIFNSICCSTYWINPPIWRGRTWWGAQFTHLKYIFEYFMEGLLLNKHVGMDWDMAWTLRCGKCWHCEKPTHWVSISFEAPLCRGGCQENKWREYQEACRRAGPIQTIDLDYGEKECVSMNPEK